jgi:hypothetical protein
MNSKALSEHLKVSRASISRWVASGCPHTVRRSRFVFDIDQVKAWRQARLKRYHVFDAAGYYHGVAVGSANLIARLKAFRVSTHRPYGVDDSGVIHFIYSGKLRRQDSIKTNAGVLIQYTQPAAVADLMETVKARYMSRR